MADDALASAKLGWEYECGHRRVARPACRRSISGREQFAQ